MYAYISIGNISDSYAYTLMRMYDISTYHSMRSFSFFYVDRLICMAGNSTCYIHISKLYNN